jgi:predicted RNA polymerase sigma factor
VTALERIFREEYGRVVAVLIRDLRDVELAEDALGDALAAALVAWPRQGVPEKPGAWLTTTARRKAIDRIRRERRLEELLTDLENDEPAEEREPGERLRLVLPPSTPPGVEAQWRHAQARRRVDAGRSPRLPHLGGDRRATPCRAKRRCARLDSLPRPVD